MTTSRDLWVRQTADKLRGPLEPLGYTDDECLRLAALMHDMEVDTQTGDLTPEGVVLQELLRLQGVEPATAGILARVLPTLDWGRIEIASRVAAELLGITRSTLLDNMMADRVPAWNVLMSGDRQDYITYGLARILYTHAWRRRHPPRGGPVPTFPPADYNAARYAIERRRRVRPHPGAAANA